MLKLQVIGHIGMDAVVRDLPNSQQKVISFNVAHSEKRKNAQGVQEDVTVWVRCSYFRDADKCKLAEYLKKGTQVYVEGFPTANEYTTKDGKHGVSQDVRVSDVKLLGGKGEPALVPTVEEVKPQPKPTPVHTPGFAEEPVDEDLPF